MWIHCSCWYQSLAIFIISRRFCGGQATQHTLQGTARRRKLPSRFDDILQARVCVPFIHLDCSSFNRFKGLSLRLAVNIFVPCSIITFRLYGTICFPGDSFRCPLSSGSYEFHPVQPEWLLFLMDNKINIGGQDSCIPVLEIPEASRQYLRQRTPCSSPAHKIM